MVQSDIAKTADLARRLKELRTSLNLGAVAVVGAGLSIAARFPGTAGLDSLLFESLDHHLSSDEMTDRTRANSSQASSGGSPDNLQKAWKNLDRNRAARMRFQSQFAAIDSERSNAPSEAHEALARLIHAGIVETVISLNWDTALERAYVRLYGTSIPEGVMFKPHGDCTDPSTDWVLPHEAGVVTRAVKARVDELIDQHARTLVIVGYSESDEVVSRELISPVGELWRIVRIGPSVEGEYDIPLTAEEALGQITRDLLHTEESSSWHSVSFRGSRGLEAALNGERLGPADVDACPEFSEVNRIISSLRQRHAVVLNGPSGSGKSITAYQVLRKLASSGFEVLRLRDSARGKTMASWLRDLKSFPHRKVLFIDDAQDVPADIVRELSETGTSDRLVLIVGVDQIAGGVTTVNMSSFSAVAQLAQYVRTNAKALLPLVSALDDQIGNGPGDTPLEFRLASAEKEASPWHFFYVLTGGWRRARRLAIELREKNRADIALTAVAVAQIAGVDAGVTRSELVGLLGLVERDEDWLDLALTYLLSLRAITESDGRIRCPHLQTAYHTVSWMLHPPYYEYAPAKSIAVGAIASAEADAVTPDSDPPRRTRARPPDLAEAVVVADQTLVSALIGHYLDKSSTPLRGCAWLVGRGLGGEPRWVLQYKTHLLDDTLWVQLAKRAIACAVDSTAEGAQLLTETLTWSPDVVRPVIREYEGSIAAWFTRVSPQNAWALADLINGLYSHDIKEHTLDSRQLAAGVSPSRLSTLMIEGGWGHIYSTGRGVERILTAGGVKLREEVASEVNQADYIEFLDTNIGDLNAIAELIKGMAAIDWHLAVALFERAIPAIARLYNADPVNGWSDIFDVLAFVLGFAPSFLRNRRHPPREAHAAARHFAMSLDTKEIARAIGQPKEEWSGSNFSEILSFLGEVSPKTLHRVIANVDLSDLERHLRPLANSDEQVFYIAACIWERRPGEILATLERIEPILTRLSPYFAIMSPELAFRAMRRGVPFDLGLQHHEWAFATEIVVGMVEADVKLTRELLDSNMAAMVEGLASNSSDPFEGLAKWVAAVDSFYPSYIERVLRALPKGAVLRWSTALKRPKKYGHTRRREIAPLVFRACHVDGHVGQEAAMLLNRYSSLTDPRVA
jgi:hypothetical protein